MNYNKELFNEIVECVGSVLTDTTDQPAIHDDFYKSIAMDYCSELLVKTYNATKQEFKKPKKMLELAFAAGCFCRIVNEMSNDEENNYINITSILSDTVLSIDGVLVGLLLNSDAVKAKETFRIAQSLAVDDCLTLTHQKKILLGIEGKLKDNMTVLYAMFLFGCSQNIKYH
ncbi:MAG: hypothetical protein IKD04_03470 [Clostridia bacterium]|nr:hypothetical protein [Clostridia bacterium]